MNVTQAEKKIPPQQIIKVTRKDLPLCCPRSDDGLVGLHPRVYLPIEKCGVVVCPYCGARYKLAD
jgi:uncharacterized Zn-finger protein